jgi:hypothetical protein
LPSGLREIPRSAGCRDVDIKVIEGVPIGINLLRLHLRAPAQQHRTDQPERQTHPYFHRTLLIVTMIFIYLFGVVFLPVFSLLFSRDIQRDLG